jgi:hypothetical protein
MENEEPVSTEQDGISIKGWPVFEGDWKRVILFTEADF